LEQNAPSHKKEKQIKKAIKKNENLPVDPSQVRIPELKRKSLNKGYVSRANCDDKTK
jgi:hypothetical protein